ncbi:TIM barrel protein [Salinibacterium sp. TMP30]|uniref:TIM barrel protein n=1 Tax=Salinibacterium sp. TMP30 TaxID=3138237 RepID=UPI0031397A20
MHDLTGTGGSVALILPWDSDEPQKLKAGLVERGLKAGPIRTNLFQDEDYRLGSLAHPDARVRKKAIAHIKDCVDLALELGSNTVGIWLPDGTNYPGQDSIIARKRRLEDSLEEAYALFPADLMFLLEYKFFEPAFYWTDLPDWGTTLKHVERLGDNAKVLVDMGHHAPNVNIEGVVAQVLDLGRLGGFDLNNRAYADDDLIVGSVDPFELFLVFNELVDRWDMARDVIYALDQNHSIEEKIPAILRSIMNVQEAAAKAALVDREALTLVQQSGEVLGGHEILLDAYSTDVRPLIADWREHKGLPRDPIGAFKASGYADKISEERGTAGDIGW